MSKLRVQFAREQEAMKREIAALGRQLGEEAAARRKFAQELGSLKIQFAEAQTKLDRAYKQHMREYENLWKENFAPPRTQFPFTSDPPEKGKMPEGGTIADLTAKCGGNVGDKGVVTITASSICRRDSAPRNVADLANKDSEFCSANKPHQWSDWDFKELKIEPTHSTIRTHKGAPNTAHLKSWAIEGSDNDGETWMEIDRRENNNDLNAKWAVKTFPVLPSGSFSLIRLRTLCHQGTTPNHRDDDDDDFLALSGFEILGTVIGL
jgi:hypothetical protein